MSATTKPPVIRVMVVDDHEVVRQGLKILIRAVAEGQSLLDPTMTGAVLERLRKGKALKDEKLARLSPQEKRILSLVADGKTNREIGEDLRLAEKTVKNYVSTILTKLEVGRRAEAAAYLARHTQPPGSQ
jgi:DNA-binding NarL/FixJ family response regulator